MTKKKVKLPTEPGAVIGYIRVSTAEQADSGLGLAAQRATIAACAASRGWEVAQVHEDAGVSAKTLTGRPGMVSALMALASGEASVLVVAKLDRLARSVADFAGLVRRAEKEGWALVVSDLAVDMTTSSGSLIANVMASVAQWERQVIAERTRAALEIRREEGMKLGRPRLLDPAIFKRIRTERAGGATFHAIADRLNIDGITTPTGRTWSPALVRKITLQDTADS